MNSYVLGGLVGLIGAAAIAAALWRHRPSRRWRTALLLTLIVVIVAAAVTSIGFGRWMASGDRAPIAASEISPGITYERLLIDDAVGHLMSFDLADECLQLITTQVRADASVDAQMTTSWARDQNAVAAINSNYFFPYAAGVPWGDPTPIEGGEVNILGTVKQPGHDPISADSEYGRVRHRVWVDTQGVPGIGLELDPDADIAVTGRELILEQGRVVGHVSEDYARTVVGIAEGTTRMWWLVVDGKRPGYSEGVTFDEAAGFLASIGATDAVAMDGGGSTTMVADDGSGVRMLNQTINQGIPNRERAIANHLGLVRPPGCV